ncbi:MAG: hypothetical protein QM534_06355 [Sediminibacterium sp.]|nr:hypothetical protein [Sediminibacterium sp.]
MGGSRSQTQSVDFRFNRQIPGGGNGRTIEAAALRRTLCDFARARKRPEEATGAAAKATKDQQAKAESVVFEGRTGG